MNNNIGEARRSYAATIDGGFSQEDAARYFGVSLSTYQKWEQGAGKSIKIETLCDIADLYGTSVDYLLCRTGNPKFSPVKHMGKYERELAETCSRLNDQQIDLLVMNAKQFAVANEKNGAGDRQDVGRAGQLVK